MGQTISLTNTELGQSLIGNLYETTKPMGLRIMGENKQLEEWRERPNPVNPTPKTRVLRLPLGVKFKVVDVKRFQSIKECNTFLVIEVLNDVWCDELVEYVASDAGRWSKTISNNIALSITGNVKMYVGDLEENAIKMIL